jgi:hypothetical protein
MLDVAQRRKSVKVAYIRREEAAWKGNGYRKLRDGITG